MTTAVKSKKPVRVVDVMSLLKQLTRGHDFKGTQNRPASNFEHVLPEAVKIMDTNKCVHEIPADSVLVVYQYRNPASKVLGKNLSLATFHHPGAVAQTVIDTDGVGITQDLSVRSMYDSLQRKPGRSFSDASDR